MSKVVGSFLAGFGFAVISGLMIEPSFEHFIGVIAAITGAAFFEFGVISLMDDD